MDIREHYVLELPPILEVGAKYFVLDFETQTFEIFIINQSAEAIPARYAKEDVKTEYGLSGTIDGVNKTFTVTSTEGFKMGSTQLFINGVRQFLAVDYNETDAFTIEIIIAPENGDNLILDYKTQ